MKQVSDWMKSPVLTTDGDTSILDAAKKMQVKKSSYIAVLNGKKPVGLLTDKELVSFVSTDKLPSSTKVKDVSSKNFVTVSPEDSILDVCTVFNTKNLTLMLVVKDDKLVGTLSMGDIIKGLVG
ncbi:CBS domain-containing protein [Candidatus Woesearchaeota archaeon]|nr:CBS domain-containing protein [Candidatus Woesearchaeota archaeon]